MSALRLSFLVGSYNQFNIMVIWFVSRIFVDGIRKDVVGDSLCNYICRWRNGVDSKRSVFQFTALFWSGVMIMFFGVIALLAYSAWKFAIEFNGGYFLYNINVWRRNETDSGDDLL